MNISLRKALSRTVLLVMGAGLGGCTATPPLVISQPVGPAQAVSQPGAARGQLLVYTAWNRLDTLDSEHQKHTAYTVRSDERSDKTRVRNQCGSFGQDPETVSLTPGKYMVEARAINVGPIQVPVVIRAGQTTVVYLDGLAAPAAQWQGETNWVRQPNGLIVGWQSTANR